MQNKFYLNYFNAIRQGLADSKYYLDQQTIEPDMFFQRIKNIFLKLKESKNRIYFFTY